MSPSYRIFTSENTDTYRNEDINIMGDCDKITHYINTMLKNKDESENEKGYSLIAQFIKGLNNSARYDLIDQLTSLFDKDQIEYMKKNLDK